MINPFKKLCEIVKDNLSPTLRTIDDSFQDSVPDTVQIWSEADQQRFEESRKWLFSHYNELHQKYRGRYIAVANSEIITSGRDPEKVLETIDKLPCPRGVILMYFDPKDRLYAFG